VQQGARGHFVWVVNKAGKAEQRPVQVGEWYGESWFIAQGLAAGDQVVVDGGLRLAPDAPVKAAAYVPKPGAAEAAPASAPPGATLAVNFAKGTSTRGAAPQGFAPAMKAGRIYRRDGRRSDRQSFRQRRACEAAHRNRGACRRRHSRRAHLEGAGRRHRQRPARRAGSSLWPAIAGYRADMFSRFFIERPIRRGRLDHPAPPASSRWPCPGSAAPDDHAGSGDGVCDPSGRDSKTLADSVAAPIEAQINGVDNMLYMSSTSSSSGQLTLTVYFSLDTNPDIAQVQVQNRVNLALPQLPSAVTQQGVSVQKKSSSIMMLVAVFNAGGRYSADYIANYANVYVLDALKRAGAGQAQVMRSPTRRCGPMNLSMASPASRHRHATG
jgi:hypothetical protein